jgi:hypothetical protein
VSGERLRRVKRVVLSSVILTLALCAAARAESEGKSKPGARTIVGVVYFTNNSPDDYAFLVELFNSRRRRVAVKWTPEQTGNFEFKGLKPGKYYLQVSGPNICLLQYEVDAREKQPERLQVFGDAGCGHHSVGGLALPRPVPRKKKR